ncbi:MAG: hypothetical protein NTZ20_03910 [Candidatus Levybacteria bacterium]|nr:hypothetical protein [Candidatus Levybacteria bacterium]
MNIFQNLTSYFRNQYISWLRAYPIHNLPVKIEELEIYKDLPKWMVAELQTVHNAYKPNTEKKLYLIKFDKTLSTDQAEHELNLLGFSPANIIEIVLFINKYSKIAHERPIIALNAYHDFSKTFNELLKTYSRHPKYDLCICYTSSGFERPAEIESGEALTGAAFSAGIQFLAKSI